MTTLWVLVTIPTRGVVTTEYRLPHSTSPSPVILCKPIEWLTINVSYTRVEDEWEIFMAARFLTAG